LQKLIAFRNFCLKLKSTLKLFERAHSVDTHTEFSLVLQNQQFFNTFT